MKHKTTWLAAVLLSIGSASAQPSSITVTDGTGNTYGAATGIGIDFDSALTLATAPWTPPLVNGLQYSLNSISLRDASDSTGSVYLGVYSTLSSGVMSGFMGASLNSVDFSTVANGDWAQFNFSGITVTTDNTPGAGSGLLYFGFQSVNTATTTMLTDAMHRIDGFGSYSIQDYGNNVIAYGALQTTRALEFQATVTPVPEPGTCALALGGLGAMTLFRRRKV
ncbi:MAG TPA: PEP-CTERM sorting domain-containing protein [Candidatus Paceibacterota bacterium]|nr:PEP-CTERM sorting domain-containing protein [Candidatus Paceibacterota bacterium]